MSSVLYALGHWAVRRRRLVVALWAALIVLLGASAGLLARPMADVFDIPGTQSQRAMDALASRFPEFAGASGQVVVSAPAGAKVTDAAVTARIEDLTARYAALPHVRGATSPFNEHVKGTVSADGTTGIIAAVVADRRRRDLGRLMRDVPLRDRLIPPDPLVTPSSGMPR